MAESSHEDLLKQHQILLQTAAAEQKAALADRDLAKQNLDAGTPEQRPELEKKFFDTQAVLEQKTDKYAEAQTALDQVPKDSSPTLLDQAKGAIRIAGVLAQSFSPDLPAMPLPDQVASTLPVHQEMPYQRTPEEEGRQTQEAFKQGADRNEALNKVLDNAPRSGTNPGGAEKESMTIEAQGSASFGAQAFSSSPEPFPNRSPANDNDPPNKGGAPSAAQPAPANDNQKPADAVAAQPAVSSRVAADFGAPLPPPPPPPPPPPLEQESRMAR